MNCKDSSQDGQDGSESFGLLSLTHEQAYCAFFWRDKSRRGKYMLLTYFNNRKENKISVWNNGRAIPVQNHVKEKMWIPTLIFGHLLSGSNFNDDEKKTTGGRNGFGAKLCNVFSSKFVVSVASKEDNATFKQVIPLPYNVQLFCF